MPVSRVGEGVIPVSRVGWGSISINRVGVGAHPGMGSWLCAAPLPIGGVRVGAELD